MSGRPPASTLFPYTTLFRSLRAKTLDEAIAIENRSPYGNAASLFTASGAAAARFEAKVRAGMVGINVGVPVPREPFAFGGWKDRKSTRLNSSHVEISYAVFC